MPIVSTLKRRVAPSVSSSVSPSSLDPAKGLQDYIRGLVPQVVDAVLTELGPYFTSQHDVADFEPGVLVEEINAALQAGKEVRLAPGVYSLTGPVVFPTHGGRLFCDNGVATLQCAANWSVGAADDPQNALILLQSVLDTTFQTTVAGTADRADETLTLTTTAGLAAGEWLLVYGHNGVGDAANMADGANVELAELVQVSAVGTPATLVAGLRQCHVAGVAADRVRPVIGAEVSNLRLVGDAGLAVGIFAQGVVGLVLNNIRGRGFSRSLIELSGGTTRFEVNYPYSEGANHGLVHGSSVMVGVVREPGSSQDGARGAATGIPRPLLYFRHRSSDLRVEHPNLNHAYYGIRFVGGWFNSVVGGAVSDMFLPSAIKSVGDTATIACGTGFLSGATGADAEIGWGNAVCGTLFVDCAHESSDDGVVLVRDQLSFGLDCSIQNRGQVGASGRWSGGLLLHNCQGSSSLVSVQGQNYGLRTAGAQASMWFMALHVDGAAGSGAPAASTLEFGHTAQGPQVDVLRMPSGGAIGFTAGFLSTPDFSLFIRQAILGSQVFSDCGLAWYQAASPALAAADVVELDPVATTPTVVVPSGVSTKSVVVAVGGSATLVLVSMGGRRSVKCSTALVQLGDLVVANISRRGVANNGAAAFQALGRAVTYKAAGSEGVVLVEGA